MQLSLSRSPLVSARAPSRRLAFRAQRCTRLSVNCVAQPQRKDENVSAVSDRNVLLSSAAMLTPFLIEVQSALAKDGEYGILEGRTIALIHPAVMGVLFFGTLYAGYLGYQWKRTREVGEEIRELKKQLPAPAADGAPVQSPLTSVIEQKEQERKALVAGNYRDKHWWWGSVLLASGVGIAIEGCVNTFMRTGRLFPGPHLYAGAAIVFLWAAAAALVPAMQKGDNSARQAHIALNALNVGLFLWQVPTGLEIVGKVFQFTQWP
mmetsp:Transcript_5287/g.11580  ORF Transcript_5287/g.11580 Transcript_5287/m.11580 type:complete len:264 (-) Transcript_5287:454-1245(-)|eukprot:CAMPEP_0202902220 /NCGR_PEP_ID=MMETSP1392-20130828/16731_1 /ASSEMBLY_ACC=CAM_ASM_000868 /TAXON_ID=225041 /ORGANISM="Chlamydomonas chlamydogama, Strain SAG 11-48b" /LENGTH=263 /DNA_ID=CAMNT_0049588955 /DNA_START=78 /DNA_END=869 /DNA_ORIENTATION=+